MQYRNPIVPGFHPDPSICRVGEDYYLVTSSFEFFPGVPIYHSRNLTDWELISYCLTTPSQLPLEAAPASKGIYAPTIRYHDGTFYMTTTNTTGGGNFIVWAEDIRGPWSDPVWIDQPGIDPSLLFDNGEVIFCSNYRQVPHGISACRINPKTGEKFTESLTVGTGTGGQCCEGPHIYHIGEYYYLMMAEGGTGYGHMITLKRGRSAWGPFDEACPHNPILTQKDRKGHPLQCAGHGDLFEDHRGNWWMVFLGVRPLEGRTHLHNLGRETFLAPVVWQDGWPVVGNAGTVELEMEGPLWEAPRQLGQDWQDDFSSRRLEWNFVRNPQLDRYEFGQGLALTAGAEHLSSPTGSPTALLRRQQAFDTEAVARLRLEGGPRQLLGGLTAYLTYCHHYDLLVQQQGERLLVGVRKSVYDMQFLSAQVELPRCQSIWLRIQSDEYNYTFSYSLEGEVWHPLGQGTTSALCSEITRGANFNGVYYGLFCDEGCLQADCFRYRER